MSKRFGRNQKQKLKAELSAQHKMNMDVINSANTLRRQVRDLQHNIKDIVDTVESFCYNSAAIEPKRIQAPSSQEFRLPMRASLYDAVSSYSATTALKTVDVYELKTHIESHKDSFSLKVHLKFGDDERVIYALSKDALFNMPTHILVERVLPNLTREMLVELKRGFQ